MTVIGILFGLLIVLLAMLLLNGMRRVKAEPAEYRSQRMCPSCGLITSRSMPRCLECGQPFTAVVYATLKK